MREQASIIQAEVGKRMEDVLRLDQRVGKLESHFDQARRDIAQIRTSSTKIPSRGEKIGELELEAAEPEAEPVAQPRSQAPTSELQSLMPRSYAAFCVQKKPTGTTCNQQHHHLTPNS